MTQHQHRKNDQGRIARVPALNFEHSFVIRISSFVILRMSLGLPGVRSKIHPDANRAEAIIAALHLELRRPS